LSTDRLNFRSLHRRAQKQYAATRLHGPFAGHRDSQPRQAGHAAPGRPSRGWRRPVRARSGCHFDSAENKRQPERGKQREAQRRPIARHATTMQAGWRTHVHIVALKALWSKSRNLSRAALHRLTGPHEPAVPEPATARLCAGQLRSRVSRSQRSWWPSPGALTGHPPGSPSSGP